MKKILLFLPFILESQTQTNWINQISNKPFSDTRTYNFFAQTPGGSLSIGSNTITMAPCPLGTNGTDTAHYLYISGGTGAAEAVLITGGTCTSGSSGNVIITAANTHTGAWTIASATGGLQEAICAMPSGGGQSIITASITLNANVSTCGKTTAIVNKYAGSLITNSATFTIFGTNPTAYAQALFTHASPNFSSIATLYNGTQFDIGGYPDVWQNGFTTGGTVQSLVGSININTNPSMSANIFGIAGYGRSSVANGLVVGLYGGGTCAGANVQCWGTNATVQHDSNGDGGGTMTAGEFDVGHSAAGALRAATLRGVSSVILATTAQTGQANAFEAIKSSLGTNAWSTAFVSDDNAASGGLSLGHAPGAGAQTSQSITMTANNGTMDVSGTMFVTSGSQFYFRPPVGGALQFDPKNTGSSTVTILSTGGMQLTANTYATISGAVTCAGGTEGTMWPVTDSNTATFNATIAGGGTNHGIAYCNGTNWVFH